MSTYIRWEGKVRETGMRVQILDLAHQDSEFDVDGGNRWGTICMDHSILVTHPTSQLAWDHAAHPLTWCDICRDGEPEPEPVVETPKRSRKHNNPLGLPAKSFDYFRALADDAANWNGNPWLDGNVASGRSASGMSQALVRHGLITVWHDDEQGLAFASFTPAGIEAASKVGIDLTWIQQ
jgi:hypothetical protein